MEKDVGGNFGKKVNNKSHFSESSLLYQLSSNHQKAITFRSENTRRNTVSKLHKPLLFATGRHTRRFFEDCKQNSVWN